MVFVDQVSGTADSSYLYEVYMDLGGGEGEYRPRPLPQTIIII